MRAALGLAPDETESTIIAAACADSAFACDAVKQAALALAKGTKTDQERGAGIGTWLAAPTGRAAGFESYAELYLTKGEIRARLARAIGSPVQDCRQHWLKFTWAATWQAQATAGFTRDSTLGFNDRPGFRTGAALEYRPLIGAAAFTTTPLVLMDSQFYDYGLIAPDARQSAMAAWTSEVRAVGGTAAVLWHPHTLAPDYGWGVGFGELLKLLNGYPEMECDA